MSDRTVRVRFEALIGQYEAAMAKAGLSTKSLGHTVDSISKGSERSFKSMALGLKDVGGGALLAGAGIAVAGVALTKFVHEGVDSYVQLVDSVKAYKNVTGASAEESSRMVALAKVLGVSADTLANGMFRMARNVRANSEALAADGVQIARTKSGQVDLSATLLNVADAYQRVGGGNAGALIAQDAFGRGGRALIPILKQSREEIQGFWKDAANHGEIMTDADLKAVFDYKVSIRELDEAWAGLERKAAPGVVKALTGAAKFGENEIAGWQRLGHDMAPAVNAVTGLLGHLPGLSSGHKDAADSARKHAEAEQAAADAMETEAQKSQEFKNALDVLYTTEFSVADTQDKFNQDLAAFADTVNAAKASGDAYATSLDASTATGIENRQMVRGLAKDILDTAKAAEAAGTSVEDATQVQRNALATVLEQLGFNKEEAQKYADALAGLDGLVVSSKVELDTKDALAALADFKAKYGEVAYGVTRPDLLDEHDRLAIAAGQGIPDSIASPDLIAARQRADAQRWRDAVAANELAGRAGPKTKAELDKERQDAETWRKAMEQNAKDARAEQLREKGAEYEFGGISATDYKAFLEARLAETKKYSVEWTSIMSTIKSVDKDIGAAWTAAADQIKANEAEWMRVLDVQHEIGELSTDDYLKQLEKRLAGLQKYSDEWYSTWQKINQLKDSITQTELEIIRAVDKQRQYDQAFIDAADSRALSTLRAAAPSPVVVHGGSTTTSTISAPITVSDTNTAVQVNRSLRHLSYELN